MVAIKGNTVEITAATLAEDNEYVTVFDAVRDNKGKGLPAKDLLKMLRNMK